MHSESLNISIKWSDDINSDVIIGLIDLNFDAHQGLIIDSEYDTIRASTNFTSSLKYRNISKGTLIVLILFLQTDSITSSRNPKSLLEDQIDRLLSGQALLGSNCCCLELLPKCRGRKFNSPISRENRNFSSSIRLHLIPSPLNIFFPLPIHLNSTTPTSSQNHVPITTEIRLNWKRIPEDEQNSKSFSISSEHFSSLQRSLQVLPIPPPPSLLS
jgi:hypothetical protein